MLQVSDDFIQILACLFSNAWRIFVSFNIPGTNITVPELAFACLMILFVLRWVGPLLGVPSAGDQADDVASHNARITNDSGMYSGLGKPRR